MYALTHESPDHSNLPGLLDGLYAFIAYDGIVVSGLVTRSVTGQLLVQPALGPAVAVWPEDVTHVRIPHPQS